MLPEKKVGTPSIVAPVARFERIRFDLSTTPAAEVFTQEMRRVVLQGSISNYVVPDRCNIIESRLARVATDSVDFSRCDFKDNAIVDCRFSETKFVGTGFMLNTVAKSRFLTCNFFDTVIQNCEFYDVEFQDCDFTSLVIKDCHFSHCVFTGCKTSSKLFEMCLLNNCKFSETQLQFQTVIENFGLMNGQVNVPLRSDRVDHPHEQIELQALKAKLLVEVNPLARLALDYFLNGSLLDGSEHLDAALDVQYWIRSQSTIGSFSIVLTRLCEFLLQLHGRDELAYLPLVQFHTVTGALASLVPADARMRQAEFAVYGAHLSLARQIDAFGEAVSRLTRSRRRKLTLLVEDGRAKASYKRELPDLFRRGRPRIVSLTPHNSPWEMVLAFPSSAALATAPLQMRNKVLMQLGAQRPLSVTDLYLPGLRGQLRYCFTFPTTIAIESEIGDVYVVISSSVTEGGHHIVCNIAAQEGLELLLLPFMKAAHPWKLFPLAIASFEEAIRSLIRTLQKSCI